MDLFDYSNAFVKEEAKNAFATLKVLSVTEFNQYVNTLITIQSVIV